MINKGNLFLPTLLNSFIRFIKNKKKITFMQNAILE